MTVNVIFKPCVAMARIYIAMALGLVSLFTLPLRWTLAIVGNVAMGFTFTSTKERSQSELQNDDDTTKLTKAIGGMTKVDSGIGVGDEGRLEVADEGRGPSVSPDMAEIEISDDDLEPELPLGDTDSGLVLLPPSSDAVYKPEADSPTPTDTASTGSASSSGKTPTSQSRPNVVKRFMGDLRRRHQQRIEGGGSFIGGKSVGETVTAHCNGCQVTFATILKRKQYCNNCGNLFCSKCCSLRVPKSFLGVTAPTTKNEQVLICNRCFSQLDRSSNTAEGATTQSQKSDDSGVIEA